MVFAVSAAPPRGWGCSTPGLLWGQIQQLQAGISRKDRNERVPPSPATKRGWSCLKYIQMRGILSFPPKKKRTRNTRSPLSVKLNSSLSNTQAWLNRCCCCQLGGRGYSNSGSAKNGAGGIDPLCAVPKKGFDRNEKLPSVPL